MQDRLQQPKNLNAQIVDTMGQRIVTGHYKSGEQLPVEADLCTEFGVSRSIMREATKVLMAKGLLASKPRVGTLVKGQECWNLLDVDVLSWVTEALPGEDFLDMLFEARMALEPSAAELAARKASPEDILAIGKAYREMEAAKTVEESLEPDIRFHQAIMDATHNQVIRYIGHTLHNALAISIRLTNWHPDIHILSLPRHEAVYLAIRDRDPRAAARAAKNLLQDSRGDFDTQNQGKNECD